MATPCEGQRLLLKFIDDHGLTKADFHRTLQKRFGSKTVPGYFTVNSWIVGKRRPGERGQVIIEKACAIPRPAWLTEKELARERWRNEQLHADDIGALEQTFSGGDESISAKPRRQKAKTVSRAEATR